MPDRQPRAGPSRGFGPRRGLASLTLLLLAACAGPPPAAEQEPPYLWVQMAPDRPVEAEGGRPAAGQLIARALLPAGGACPEIELAGRDGVRREALRERLPATRAAFPFTLCELRYDGSLAARLGGRELPRRPERIERVLVIGDTGCRLTYYLLPDRQQDCNDPGAWPFARVAAAAAAAGRDRPFDLIVHVGDYHYREAPCPDALPGCAGSPWGDRGAAWLADFFRPARPLLAAAPWVFVRGNHETCARAGDGFLQLLGAEVRQGPPPLACEDDGAPYWLESADLDLLVLDTADAGDAYGAAGRARRYERWIAAALADARRGRDLWLLLHQPLWTWPFAGAEALRAASSAATLNGIAAAVARAAADPAAPEIEQVLSGHVHLFGVVAPEARPAPGRRLPWQGIYGASGTKPNRPQELKGLPSWGAAATLADGAERLNLPLTVGGPGYDRPPEGAALPPFDTGSLPLFSTLPYPPGPDAPPPPAAFAARASLSFAFGFAVIERGAGGGQLRYHGRGGEPLLSCRLRPAVGETAPCLPAT